MQYLVQLRAPVSSRAMSLSEGIEFIEELVFPTLEQCAKLLEQKKILAGGPVSGTVALALIVSAGSVQELDDLITSLPLWSRMETRVIPLNTFEGRKQSLLSKLDKLKAQERDRTRPGPTGVR